MWYGFISKWLRKPTQKRRVMRAAIRLAHRIESAQWDDWLEATSLVNVVNDLLEESVMETVDFPVSENSAIGTVKFSGDSIPVGAAGYAQCPSCGRCPTCGHSDRPWYYWPTYPQYPAYSGITCTTAAAY